MRIYYNKNSDVNNLTIALDETFCKNHNWTYSFIDLAEFDVSKEGLKIVDNIVQKFTKNLTRPTQKTLRIKKLMDSTIPFTKDFDFTLLSELTKESPLYDKGRKLESNYTHRGILIVKKVFEDVVVNNKLQSIKMTINWYNEDGTVGLTKRQIIQRFNSAEVKTHLRKRRQRAIDYLEASAEEKGFGWIIDLILTNFKTELELFILSGSSIFKDVILAELTNPNSKVVKIPTGQEVPLSYILNQKLPATEKYPQGQTVAEGVIEEIV